MKLLLDIKANEGYNTAQVAERNNIYTVGDLKRCLEDFNDDVEIYTKNLNNEYGATFGAVVNVEEDFSDEEDY